MANLEVWTRRLYVCITGNAHGCSGVRECIYAMWMWKMWFVSTIGIAIRLCFFLLLSVLCECLCAESVTRITARRDAIPIRIRIRCVVFEYTICDLPRIWAVRFSSAKYISAHTHKVDESIWNTNEREWDITRCWDGKWHNVNVWMGMCECEFSFYLIWRNILRAPGKRRLCCCLSRLRLGPVSDSQFGCGGRRGVWESPCVMRRDAP